MTEAVTNQAPASPLGSVFDDRRRRALGAFADMIVGVKRAATCDAIAAASSLRIFPRNSGVKRAATGEGRRR